MDFLRLSDKTFLVFGVANRKSVAFHVGRVLTEAGARVLYAVRSEQRKLGVEKLVGDAEVFVCDVESADEIARLRDDVALRHPRLDGMVHSIAFAGYEGGPRPFHETSKADSLR